MTLYYGIMDKWVNNVLFVHGTLSVPLVEFLFFLSTGTTYSMYLIV